MRTQSAAVLLVASLSWPAFAADPASIAKAVAPYLDDQAIVVARMDLAAMDVDAVAERFVKSSGLDAQTIAEPRRMVREAIESFRKAGATELYAVVSVVDIPSPGPFVLVPRAGAKDDELKRALAVFGYDTVEPLNGVMFAGGKAALERLRSLKPAARPDLQTALAACSGSAVQIAVVPGDDQRKVAGELLPPLPPALGGGPAAPLVKAFRWAAVGVDTKPKLGVKIVVQAADAAAASTYQTAINRGLDWVGQQKEISQVLPKFADLRPILSPKVAGERLTIAVDESNAGVAAAFAGMTARVRSSAGRTQSMNNIKQIALAWHNHLDAYRGTFPADIMSKDGKPLLSWRVAILPFIEQNDLYKQFHLDEPWDSEHNKSLIEKMPVTYRSPAQKIGGGKTTYLAPAGKIGDFHVGVLGARIRDVTDGTSNTVMIVESNDEAAVVWTKPSDLTVDAKDPIKGLVGHYPEGFIAGYADGSVRFIRSKATAKGLLAIFTRDGGEVVDDKDF